MGFNKQNTLCCLSLLLRLAYAPFTDFGVDQKAIYQNGLVLFEKHLLLSSGARVVYTHTVLPGALLNLWTGLPLFFSSGHPVGVAFCVAILNFFVMLGLFFFYRSYFLGIPSFLLLVMILFAPWGILFTSIWNPSYVTFYSSLFFLGVYWLFDVPQKVFWASFLIGFSLVSLFQIHLCVMVLIALFVFFYRWFTSFSWKGMLIGGALAGITLIPYFLEGEVAHAVVTRNVLLPLWSRLSDFPGFFSRFLSFASAETAYFICEKGGVVCSAKWAFSHFWSAPFFVLSSCYSLAVVFLGAQFYLRNLSWVKYVFSPPKDPKKKFPFFVWVTPLFTGFCFLFSPKGPSAHTFWFLMPLSFFPVFYELKEKKWADLVFASRLFTRLTWVLFFVLIGNIFYSAFAHAKKDEDKIFLQSSKG